LFVRQTNCGSLLVLAVALFVVGNEATKLGGEDKQLP